MHHPTSSLAAAALLIVSCVSASGQTGHSVPGTRPTSEAGGSAWERHQLLESTSPFRGLAWRSVGPVVMGGRLVDIEGVPGKPYAFYVAYASGGVWKTENNGVTFQPLFDEQPTVIIGDLALDPSDPEVVWVGTGENNSSRSSYGGRGVFRSDDAGRSWRPMGLAGTDRIGRVLVDPRDGDRVYVAALGPLYSPGGDRGIYRTTDGGESWERVLDGADWTGFTDLAFEPGDPDVLYAASWERRRRPWDFTEGGEGSGIWKSVDGGDTWTRLAGGLPRGADVGRIGLAVSASDPAVVYASVDNQQPLPEADWDLGDGAVTPKRLRSMSREQLLAQDPEEIEDFLRSNDLDPRLDARSLLDAVERDSITIPDLLSALENANNSLFQTDIRGIEVWRSDDRGESWRRTNPEPIRDVVFTYGYYFGQIRIAPDDPDEVYVLGVPLLRSDDGGRRFRQVAGRDVHGDHQSLWIDPAFPDRLVLGNDGGLAVSYDGGESWLGLNAVPVGQFYTIAVDMAEPYNIYGGLQDNGVFMGSSRARPGIERWRRVGGGDGMYVQIDPRDNRTVVWGFQFGNYFRQGPDGRDRIKPRNGILDPALRYNWLTPVIMSEHNPDVLYFGADRLFRSLDQGDTWSAISGDLTGGPVRGDVPFATITTVAESPLRFGLLWVGTDDGRVWVSRGGGADWSAVDTALPRDRWVSRVEASRHVPERAYLSLNGYRDDDPSAYVFRTDDLGRSWRSIADGLPAEPVNVVREDPVHSDVVYVGTDRGVYVSLDGGRSWHAAGAGLPNVPVHDLVVHPRERELVAGTHGRSVWVLDALPIQELSPEVREGPVHVFPMDPVPFQREWRARRSPWYYRPEDAPYRSVSYWVRDGGAVEWSLLDDLGRVLRRGSMDAVPGVNTFRWDFLLDEALALEAEAARLEETSVLDPDPAATPWSEAVRLGRPPYVTPGSYTIRVEVGGERAEAELTVEPPEPREPRVPEAEPIRGRRGKSGR